MGLDKDLTSWREEDRPLVKKLLSTDVESSKLHTSRGLGRKLIVAPSGSGKTTFVKEMGKDKFVDLDTIIPWPTTWHWWTDPIINPVQQRVIASAIGTWLRGPRDGKIGFYADDVSDKLRPDAYVVIPREQLEKQLASRDPSLGQPTELSTDSNWFAIKENPRKMALSFPSFHEAVDFVRSDEPISNEAWKQALDKRREYNLTHPISPQPQSSVIPIINQDSDEYLASNENYD